MKSVTLLLQGMALWAAVGQPVWRPKMKKSVGVLLGVAVLVIAFLVIWDLRPEQTSRIDPELASPPVDPSPLPVAIAIEKLPWVGAGKAALDVFEKAQEAKPSDSRTWLKLGMTLYDGKYYAEALKAFEEMQIQAHNDASFACAALVWQGHVLDLLEQREEALKCYKEAMKDAGRLNMSHSQYGIRLNRRWVERRLQEPFVRE